MLMGDQTYQHILDRLPYGDPFLFVDRIAFVNSERVEGYYRFREDLEVYRGHFKDAPVTPGVLLTECCAQIGLVCLGIHLLGGAAAQEPANTGIAMTESRMEFLHPVYPGQEVRVAGEKAYFRFGKLKAFVRLYTDEGVLACRGEIAGMLTSVNR